MLKERLLDGLDRKFGRYGIRNLMTYIVGGMAVVYLMDLIVYPMTGFSLRSVLAFSRSAVMHGQIWRLVTFIFIPPDSNILFILFSLYFYWLIGNALENQWGAFRFNVYYLCGIVCTLMRQTAILTFRCFLRLRLCIPIIRLWYFSFFP